MSKFGTRFGTPLPSQRRSQKKKRFGLGRVGRTLGARGAKVTPEKSLIAESNHLNEKNPTGKHKEHLLWVVIGIPR
jgi:hypothetical protein